MIGGVAVAPSIKVSQIVLKIQLERHTLSDCLLFFSCRGEEGTDGPDSFTSNIAELFLAFFLGLSHPERERVKKLPPATEETGASPFSFAVVCEKEPVEELGPSFSDIRNVKSTASGFRLFSRTVSFETSPNPLYSQKSYMERVL